MKTKFKIIDLEFSFAELSDEYLYRDWRGREIYVCIGLEGLRINDKQGYLIINAWIPYKKKGESLLSSSIPIVSLLDYKPGSNQVGDTNYVNQIKKMLTDELFNSIDADDFLTRKEQKIWEKYILK